MQSMRRVAQLVQAAGWADESVFPGDPGSVAEARQYVASHLNARGWSELVDDVRLVASELATNAVLHAGTPFTVSLRQAGALLTLVVRDGAGPWSSNGTVVDEPPAHGRGLSIVEVLSRDWGVTLRPEGGKSVWADFGITQEPTPIP